MTKVFITLLAMAFMGSSASAQIASSPNSMSIKLTQNGESYATKAVNYDYNPQKETGEMVIVNYYVHEKPGFAGGTYDGFTKWIASSITGSMDSSKAYDCDLSVDFVVTEDGAVKDVKVKSAAKDKEPSELERILLSKITSTAWWSPEQHYGTKFNTPMSLTIHADKYIPGKGTVSEDCDMGEYFEVLSGKLAKEAQARK